MEVVIRAKEGSQLAACFKSLLMTFGCETNTVIGHSLMYVAVFVAFGLGMPDEDD